DSSLPAGISKVIAASRIVRRARTRRLATAGLEIRNAAADLLLTKTAERFQGERHLSFLRQGWMTTGEHHLQLIVADLVIEIGPVGLRPTVCSTLEQQCDLVLLGAKILSASDDIERVIARYLREPGR